MVAHEYRPSKGFQNFGVQKQLMIIVQSKDVNQTPKRN